MEGQPLKRATVYQHPQDARLRKLITDAFASAREAEAVGDYDAAEWWEAYGHRINKEARLLQEFRDHTTHTTHTTHKQRRSLYD